MLQNITKYEKIIVWHFVYIYKSPKFNTVAPVRKSERMFDDLLTNWRMHRYGISELKDSTNMYNIAVEAQSCTYL